MGLCLCAGIFVMAQEIEIIETVEASPVLTKRGIPVLPQAGDYAIGISAEPFLGYLGNFFGKTSANTAPEFGWDDIIVYGKYYLQDNRAIRAKIGINYGSTQDKNFVRDDHLMATDPLLGAAATVTDIRKTGTQGLYLTVGYEFRRGRGRLQGFYGGEVGVGYGKTNDTYTYGNPMTDLNQSPTTTTGTAWSSASALSSRPLKSKGGLSLGLGVGGFAGVEYFFTPQISLGGEVGLNLTYATAGQSETTTEYFNTGTGQVEEITKRSGNPGKEFTFATKGSGSIFLLFHF